MAVNIKTPEEQAGMRVAGRLAAQVLEMIGDHVRPGISTEELDRICHDFIVNEQGAIPAPLNYGAAPGRPAFPKSICTSVNEVICHGIPGPKKLKKGDIVNIDVTVIKDGFHGDTSKMFTVGSCPAHAQRLIDITHECLWAGIELVKPGANLREVGAVIQQIAESQHLTVVRDFCGHGIGTVFHEEPQVLHYDHPSNELILEEGMCFTIEPMINIGKRNMRILPDAWTAVTRDRSLSAQWEHTLLVTATGREVLTLRTEEEADKVRAN